MSSVRGDLGPATFETIEGAIAALGDKKRMGDAFEHAVLHIRDVRRGLEQT
jgi:hypothetical protein